MQWILQYYSTAQAQASTSRSKYSRVSSTSVFFVNHNSNKVALSQVACQCIFSLGYTFTFPLLCNFSSLLTFPTAKSGKTKRKIERELGERNQSLIYTYDCVWYIFYASLLSQTSVFILSLQYSWHFPCIFYCKQNACMMIQTNNKQEWMKECSFATDCHLRQSRSSSPWRWGLEKGAVCGSYYYNDVFEKMGRNRIGLHFCVSSCNKINKIPWSLHFLLAIVKSKGNAVQLNSMKLSACVVHIFL